MWDFDQSLVRHEQGRLIFVVILSTEPSGPIFAATPDVPSGFGSSWSFHKDSLDAVTNRCHMQRFHPVTLDKINHRIQRLTNFWADELDD